MIYNIAGSAARVHLWNVLSLSLFSLLALGACTQKPELSVEDVLEIRFHTPLGSWIASEHEASAFLAAFETSEVLRDDGGTTHSVRIEVSLSSEDTVWVFGSKEEPFQTVYFRSKALNLRGDELYDIFRDLSGKSPPVEGVEETGS